MLMSRSLMIHFSVKWCFILIIMYTFMCSSLCKGDSQKVQDGWLQPDKHTCGVRNQAVKVWWSWEGGCDTLQKLSWKLTIFDMHETWHPLCHWTCESLYGESYHYSFQSCKKNSPLSQRYDQLWLVLFNN